MIRTSILAGLATGLALSAQAAGVSVAPLYPDLGGQKEQCRVTETTAFRDGNRKAPIMTAMARYLSDADIASLASYPRFGDRMQSAITQKVNFQKTRIFNKNNNLSTKTSGQLRNLGLSVARGTLSARRGVGGRGTALPPGRGAEHAVCQRNLSSKAP